MNLKTKLLKIHNQYEEDKDFPDIHPKTADFSHYLKMQGLTVPKLIEYLLQTEIAFTEEEAQDFIDCYYPITDESICQHYQNLMNFLCNECGIINRKADLWLEQWQKHLDIVANH